MGEHAIHLPSSSITVAAATTPELHMWQATRGGPVPESRTSSNLTSVWKSRRSASVKRVPTRYLDPASSVSARSRPWNRRVMASSYASCDLAKAQRYTPGSRVEEGRQGKQQAGRPTEGGHVSHHTQQAASLGPTDRR